MSGPKDYNIVYVDGRFASIKSMRAAARLLRAESIKKRLGTIQRFKKPMPMGPVVDAAGPTEFLSTISEPPQEAASCSVDTAESSGGLAEEVGAEPIDTEPLNVVSAWEHTLADAPDVKELCRGDYEVWRSDFERLQESVSSLGADVTDESVRCALELTRRAELISEEAIVRQSRFQERERLLTDVMDSLRSVGFFVEKPRLEDPSDPSAAIVLRAVRSNEEMVSRFDLSDQITSNWQGIEEEHCQSAFHEYVAEMATRGVSVVAQRADLQGGPTLKQSGQCDIPDTRPSQRDSR